MNLNCLILESISCLWAWGEWRTGCGSLASETEPREVGAEVAGAGPPPAESYMYVCGDSSTGPGARYECAFEPGAPSMDQPTFEEHMFGEFGKERHVQVVVGAVGELQYRDELPVFSANGEQKRKEEPLMLQTVESTPVAHPPPPPATTTTKKSDKKKSDNNGIKKKKTR